MPKSSHAEFSLPRSTYPSASPINNQSPIAHIMERDDRANLRPKPCHSSDVGGRLTDKPESVNSNHACDSFCSVLVMVLMGFLPARTFHAVEGGCFSKLGAVATVSPQAGDEDGRPRRDEIDGGHQR